MQKLPFILILTVLCLSLICSIPRAHAADNGTWRGAGGSYLLTEPNADIATLISYWQAYLPYMQTMRFNTFRLSFVFEPGSTISLNYAKMDAVVNFLGQNGIKSVFDAHYYNISQPNLLSNWQLMTTHYLNNPYVAAFEICNEPVISNSSFTKMTNAQTYHDITVAIRAIDSTRTCVWESPLTYAYSLTVGHYIPTLDQIQNLTLPNVVYTVHNWASNDSILQGYMSSGAGGVAAYAAAEINSMLSLRDTYHVPVWIGEYGGPPGGNVVSYAPDDLQWQLCRAVTLACNSSGLGWSLWCGMLYPASIHNRLSPYADMLAAPPPPPPPTVPFLVGVSILGGGYVWIRPSKNNVHKTRRRRR